MCVSNVLLMGELPGGRGKVIRPRGKLIQRNLFSCNWWILFPGTGAYPAFVTPAPVFPPSPLLSILSSFRQAFRQLRNSPRSSCPLNMFTPIDPQAGSFPQGASTPSSGHTGNRQGPGSRHSDASHFPLRRALLYVLVWCNGKRFLKESSGLLASSIGCFLRLLSFACSYQEGPLPNCLPPKLLDRTRVSRSGQFSMLFLAKCENIAQYSADAAVNRTRVANCRGNQHVIDQTVYLGSG